MIESARNPDRQSQVLRRRVRCSAIAGAAVGVLMAFGWLLVAPQTQAKGAAVSAASGQEASWSPSDCADCHAESVEAVGKTGHVALDRPSHEGEWGVAHSCEGCHGDPSEHLDAMGGTDLFNFDQTPAVNAQRCLTCHSDSHPQYLRSEHAKAGLDCSSCHESHPSAEPVLADALRDLVGRPSATCVECHQSSFTQFSFTEHHRVEEGTMECTDCHNPHEPATRVLLAGFKQQSCMDCHADKGGPFVFEHGAQRVEGCTSCHAPHGSPNRHMLNFQQVAQSCYSCHAFIPGFHTRFTAETQCTSCHVTIHGSNLHPAFLR